jgi:hypothetical protein
MTRRQREILLWALSLPSLMITWDLARWPPALLISTALLAIWGYAATRRYFQIRRLPAPLNDGGEDYPFPISRLWIEWQPGAFRILVVSMLTCLTSISEVIERAQYLPSFPLRMVWAPLLIVALGALPAWLLARRKDAAAAQES